MPRLLRPERAAERPIAGEEFASITRTQTMSLPGRFETLGALETAALHLVNYGAPDDYWANCARTVRGLSETTLAQAAKKFIRPDEVIWIVVGDLARIEQGIRELKLGEIAQLDADGQVMAR